jgi:hypothetical protein
VWLRKTYFPADIFRTPLFITFSHSMLALLRVVFPCAYSQRRVRTNRNTMRLINIRLLPSACTLAKSVQNGGCVAQRKLFRWGCGFFFFFFSGTAIYACRLTKHVTKSHTAHKTYSPNQRSSNKSTSAHGAIYEHSTLLNNIKKLTSIYMLVALITRRTGALQSAFCRVTLICVIQYL